MVTLVFVLKITLFLVIVNVWVCRFKKSTPYRGGQATTMTEEFTSYNLPAFMLYLVGALKMLAASALLLSLFIVNELTPLLVEYSLYTMCLLMVGAILMHIKISDPLIKSLPAFLMLVISLAILFLS